MMKVTFLGTGTSTGIPLIGCDCKVCNSENPKDNRTRTSIYVETEKLKLIVDTGPDFRQQLLREKIDDLDVVLFTHPHKDHISGLDDIRPINYLKNKVIDVYANEMTLNRLKLEYQYIFENNYPGVPQIKTHLISDNDVIKFEDIHVEVLHAMHGKMPVLGFKFNKFVYLTDVNYMSKTEIEKIEEVDILVINAIHHKKHYSHFNLEEALQFIKEVNPKKAYLIHLSHKMGLHTVIEEQLPNNVFISYDGLKLEI